MLPLGELPELVSVVGGVKEGAPVGVVY